MAQDNWLQDALNGPPDFVAPPEAVFDLRGVGATINGVPIVHAGHQLAYDLEVAGYRTEEQLHAVIATIVHTARDTTQPGDVGYPIFESTITIGNRQVEVWIEQFDTDAAAIYYPRER